MNPRGWFFVALIAAALAGMATLQGDAFPSGAGQPPCGLTPSLPCPPDDGGDDDGDLAGEMEDDDDLVDRDDVPTPPASASRLATLAYVEGELLIRYPINATPAEKDAALAELGVQLRRRFERVRVDHVAVEGPATTLEALQDCQALAAIELCDLNAFWSLFAPNDSAFDMQWPFDTAGPASIGIQTAWDAGHTDSRAVWVAVIDSGVDLNHPDLMGNVVDSGFDAVHDDDVPEDRIGHGTFVAGIIGALGDNGTGVAGVSWRASLLPLKAADNLNFFERTIRNVSTLIGTGSVSAMAWADFVGAMEQLVIRLEGGAPVRVVNLSAGGAESALLEEVVLQVLAFDVLFVTASGNQAKGRDLDLDPIYPCNLDHERLLCVAAVDASGRMSGFSNFGKASVDLAAPGDAIVSTIAQQVSGSGTLLDGNAAEPLGEGLALSQGTSFATAYVSGVATLLAAVCPDHDALALKQLILANVATSNVLAERVSGGGSVRWPAALPDGCG